MLMRFTLVDDSGAISFVAPGHTLKMLAASVDKDEPSIKSMLDRLAPLDRQVAEQVRSGLAVFDEYCLREEPESIGLSCRRRLTDTSPC